MGSLGELALVTDNLGMRLGLAIFDVWSERRAGLAGRPRLDAGSSGEADGSARCAQTEMGCRACEGTSHHDRSYRHHGRSCDERHGNGLRDVCDGVCAVVLSDVALWNVGDGMMEALRNGIGSASYTFVEAKRRSSLPQWISRTHPAGNSHCPRPFRTMASQPQGRRRRAVFVPRAAKFPGNEMTRNTKRRRTDRGVATRRIIPVPAPSASLRSSI